MQNIYIEFTIIGPISEPGYWQDCQQLIATMPQHIKVKYNGAIPNHYLSKYLKPMHAMLLPTFHENFGHVIMESWQNGCPVIISDQTPWKELHQKHIGWEIALSKPGQFVKAIEELAEMDQENYTALSDASVAFALEFYTKYRSTGSKQAIISNLTYAN